MAHHELWLTNDRGERLAMVDDFLYFEGTHTVNTVGQCRVFLPTTFDTSLLLPDRMFQLWRAPKGGRLSLWRPFLIQSAKYAMRGQEETIVVGGEDCNGLLKRRVVIAAKGSSAGEIEDYADDMMKTIVYDNFVVTQYTTQYGSRDYDDFTVASDQADAPYIYHEFAFEYVIDVLRDIASKSSEYGTDLFFDVVPAVVTGSTISFEFRTYTDRIGADLTDVVTFDKAYGNFVNPHYEFDWSDVKSFIYSAGQGPRELRRLYEVYDVSRLYTSKWAWREGFIDARSADNDDDVLDAGYDQLNKQRPRKEFGGQPIDTDGTQYGRDWDFGDLVRARYRDIDVECMVESVTLTIEGGRETIGTKLKVIHSEATGDAQGGWIPEDPPE